jgi:hypothetical protein
MMSMIKEKYGENVNKWFASNKEILDFQVQNISADARAML